MRRVFGLLAFQLALVLFFFALLEGSLFGGLLAAVLAPLALPAVISIYWPFGKFAAVLVFWTAPVVLASLALCLARPALREWSLAIPLLLGLAISIPVGEWQSWRAMCEAATKHGFNEFQRNGFAWSLENRGQEFQWEIHAFAVVNGQRLGWSYSEMDWYSIPDDAWGEVQGPVFKCPTDT